MAKRRRSPTQAQDYGDSESWSELDADSTLAAESEYEYAPNVKRSTRRTVAKKRQAPTRKKAKIVKGDASKMSNASSSMPQELCTSLPSHAKSMHIISSPAALRTALLDWYEIIHDTRRMPWRKRYDPTLSPAERAQRAYEVWISEIMLQQTQVATVIPYYNRWMEKFPTIHDLADATIDEVNALWKGLGYYSRASRLLAGAQKAVKDYGGRLPDNAKDMEARIPGIGRYSAGAICSIAYGEQVPVLDGNVHRLLSRFLALHAPPKAKTTLDILWAGASAMVDMSETPFSPNSEANLEDSESKSQSSTPQHPGDINQALIELGSTVCKVRDPHCEICPLKTWCSAYRESTTSRETQSIPVIDIEDICRVCERVTDYQGVISYPMKVDRKKAREELDIVHVVEWHPNPRSENRRFLMLRRPETGLLAGFYDFPSSINVAKTITSEAQEKLAAEILSTILPAPVQAPIDGLTHGNEFDQSESISIANIRSAGDVVHVFSHIKKTYRVQWVILRGGDNPPAIRENKMPQKGRRSQKSKTEKPSVDDVNVTSQMGIQNGAIWVPLEEVMETNMGSGVVKVWNAAKSLWEDS